MNVTKSIKLKNKHNEELEVFIRDGNVLVTLTKIGDRITGIDNIMFTYDDFSEFVSEIYKDF